MSIHCIRYPIDELQEYRTEERHCQPQTEIGSFCLDANASRFDPKKLHHPLNESAPLPNQVDVCDIVDADDVLIAYENRIDIHEHMGN